MFKQKNKKVLQKQEKNFEIKEVLLKGIIFCEDSFSNIFFKWQLLVLALL